MRSVFVVLAVVLLGATACTSRPADRAESRVVTGERADLAEATATLLDGADAVTVRWGDPGPDLYRVSVPADAPVRPVVNRTDDRVRVHLRERAGDGPAEVDIALHPEVRWTIAVGAGAREVVLDLAGGSVAGVDLTGGAERIEVRLPQPRGTVPVRMTAGAGQFAVFLPAGVPSRVVVGAGAGSVTVHGRTHNGVAADTVFASPGWDDAVDRYRIEAVGGVSSLVVEPR